MISTPRKTWVQTGKFHWIRNTNWTKTWMKHEWVWEHTFQQSDYNFLLDHNVFFPWLHQTQTYKKQIHIIRVHKNRNYAITCQLRNLQTVITHGHPLLYIQWFIRFKNMVNSIDSIQSQNCAQLHELTIIFNMNRINHQLSSFNHIFSLTCHTRLISY